MEVIDDNYGDSHIEESKFHDIFEILENYDSLKQTNISKPILYKYEKTKVLGVRAEQIRNGAEPLISVSSNVTDELEIATEELKQRKIPFCYRKAVLPA